VLALLVFWGVSVWQARDLLPEREAAPQFRLYAMDGQTYSLSQAKGKPLLLYFFAPWCTVCHLSIGNLEDLRQSRAADELNIWIVALSWESPQQVQEFVNEHELTLPVLYGDAQMARDYRIGAFPTYYLLDAEGQVASRVVGYTTEFGMRWHTR
jgi:peroxiredoxin